MDGVFAALIGVLAAGVLGRALLQASGIKLLTREGEWGAAFSAGYVVLGSAYALVGFAGWFGTASLSLLTWGAFVAGSAGVLFFGHHTRRPPSATKRLFQHAPLLTTAIGAVAALVATATITRAFLPSTEGDALCYHLELPRQFLKLGRITFLPWTDHSLLPLLADVWYAVPLSTGSLLGPRLISVAVGAAFLCAVLELSVTVGGLRCAAWAILLVVAAPAFSNHASVCFSDLPVALLAAWGAVLATRMSLPGGGRLGYAAVFSLYAAGAAACKLTGLIWCVCAAIVLTAWVLARRIRSGALAAAAVGLVIVALPWYARSWYHTGNPTFPFMWKYWPGSAVVYDWRPPRQTPVPRSPLPLLSLPWRATVAPELFGGRGHQWGVAFLALLPGLFLANKKPLQPVLVLAGLYAVVWACTRQNLRFLLPVMPALAAGGAILIEMSRRRAPLLARLALGLVLLLHVAAGVAAAGRKAIRVEEWHLLTNPQRYLSAHEPTYELAKRLEALLPTGSIVLTPEHRLFYLPGVVVREDALRRWLGYTIEGRQYVQLCRFLGISHILLVRSFNPDIATYDSSLAKRIASARAELRLLLRYRYKGPDGDDRVYELLAIRPGPGDLPQCGGFDVERARALAGRLRAFRDELVAHSIRYGSKLR